MNKRTKRMKPTKKSKAVLSAERALKKAGKLKVTKVMDDPAYHIHFGLSPTVNKRSGDVEQAVYFNLTQLWRIAYDRVLKIRGSSDVPGFYLCVESELRDMIAGPLTQQLVEQMTQWRGV